MKIRFKEVVEVEFVTDVCCFSGGYSRRVRNTEIGEVLEVVDVLRGPFDMPKTKTRPGEAPRRWLHSMVLDNRSQYSMHPDRVNNVPEGSFEVVDEQRDERKRIHSDWWGKCRSCVFWKGTDAGDGSGTVGNQVRWNPGPCSNPESDMYGQETWTEGHCKKWDSFDYEVALELLDEEKTAEFRVGSSAVSDGEGT